MVPTRRALSIIRYILIYTHYMWTQTTVVPKICLFWPLLEKLLTILGVGKSHIVDFFKVVLKFLGIVWATFPVLKVPLLRVFLAP